MKRERKEFEEAADWYTKSFEIKKTLTEESGASESWGGLYLSCVTLGQIYEEAGKPEDARYEQFISIAEEELS